MNNRNIYSAPYHKMKAKQGALKMVARFVVALATSAVRWAPAGCENTV